MKEFHAIYRGARTETEKTLVFQSNFKEMVLQENKELTGAVGVVWRAAAVYTVQRVGRREGLREWCCRCCCSLMLL